MIDLLEKLNTSFVLRNKQIKKFDIAPAFHGIFEHGSIIIFPEDKYHVELYCDSVRDYSKLDEFAAFLCNLYGKDKNNYFFDPSIKDSNMKYFLYFNFDNTYGKPVTLMLEHFENKVSLIFMGCEHVISLKEFIKT